jgi:hypothetical protein
MLLFAGKWMELENIILSEVSQNAKSHMFSHMWNTGPTQIQQYHEKQSTLWGGHQRERRVKEGS